MTELTNAQLHQIREALRISLEYLPDNEDLTTVNAALDIVDRLLDVSTVVIASKEVPAKVEPAPVAAKAKTFGTVFKIGGGYLAQWFDGNEFQSRRDFETRKEANNFLRSLNAEILSAADYEFPARAARRQVWEQRKAQK